MTIQQFIEKAIEGGWKPGYFLYEYHDEVFVLRPKHVEIKEPIDLLSEVVMEPYQPFLDPLAWQAVGKVEGWPKEYGCVSCGYDGHDMNNHSGWEVKMHFMIDALAEGETIEEFLATL